MRSDIGELAENYFEHLAIKGGATANLASRDKEGWDFILQFPYQKDNTLPYDQRKPRIECLVQVKGTRTKQLSEPVSLINWEKLIKTDLPVFFAIVKFGEDDEPLDVYLVHIDEEWITRVLKRLRQLAIKYDSLPPKKKLNLKWTKQHRLQACDGISLLNNIASHIGDMESYAASKKIWRDQAGDYIPHKLTISKSGPPSDLFEELVNLSLGLSTSLDIDSMVLANNIRFGIPIEESNLGPGVISILSDGDSNAVPIKLFFSNPEANRIASFDALAYSPYAFVPKESLPIEFEMFRITFPLGQIIRRQVRESTISWKISPEHFSEAKSLRELVNIGNFLTVVDQSSVAGMTVKISNADIPPEILMDAPPIDTFSLDEHLKMTARAINNTEFLVNKVFDLPMDLEMSIYEILEQRYELELYRQLLDISYSADMSRARIGFKNLPGEFSIGMIKGIPIVDTIRFGEVSLTLGIAFAGPVLEVKKESQDDEFVYISDPRLVATSRRTQVGAAKDLRIQVFDELIQTLKNRGFDTIDSPFSNAIDQ